MKRIKNLLLLLTFVMVPQLLCAAEDANPAEKAMEVDIPIIVKEHLGDEYEWYICTVKGKRVSIPLPLILYSKTTKKWYFGGEEHMPEQFFFNKDRFGKIYERMADGSEKRAIDFSITKDVLQIWIDALIVIIIFMCVARWYRKHDGVAEAPGGFVGAMEMFTLYIYESVAKASIGEKHFKPYAPYVMTVFFFILVANWMGLVPVFPGGANLTGNLNITFLLALLSMIAINLFGNKEYWKDIFWPNVPLAIKCPVPLIPVIELVGVFTKPFALMVRLFANMMAGHAVMLSFTCVIFLGWTMSVGFGIGLNIFGVLMLLFSNCLEVLIGIVQAYVFALLTAVFIGLAHKEEEHPAKA